MSNEFITEDDVLKNLCIWNLVDKSDPAQLKKVNVGRGFLSIDAYPQIHKATKLFGPMGIGFGLTDIEYNILDDVDTSTKSNPNSRGKMMIMRSVFWYKLPGSSSMGQFPIMNSMIITGHSDTPKKMVTNSISKALSYLGFNFDVFCGSWDDDPYADRPDIPAPVYMKTNLNRLLHCGVFTDDQVKKVTEFQINAGWTLQSVQNSVKAAIEKIQKSGYPMPKLLEEGESDDGVSKTEDE